MKRLYSWLNTNEIHSVDCFWKMFAILVSVCLQHSESCFLHVTLAHLRNITVNGDMMDYPDNALFGLNDQFALELLSHLRVEELSERSLYG